MILEVEQEHFRQFSPFEFRAKAYNEHRYSDEIWDWYDRGVADGAEGYISELMFSDEV